MSDLLFPFVCVLLNTAAETGKFEEEVTLGRKNGSKFRGLLTVRPLKKENEITG